MSKIQTIKYKCCGVTFAACTEPECYTDNDWTRELKKYVKAGHSVEMIESGQGVQLGRCQCQKIKSNNQLTLQLNG